MEVGDNGLITGAERELFDDKSGCRLVFSDKSNSKHPNCPICNNNSKVYRAVDVYVCSEFHETNDLYKRHSVK